MFTFHNIPIFRYIHKNVHQCEIIDIDRLWKLLETILYAIKTIQTKSKTLYSIIFITMGLKPSISSELLLKLCMVLPKYKRPYMLNHGFSAYLLLLLLFRSPSTYQPSLCGDKDVLPNADKQCSYHIMSQFDGVAV